MTMNSVIRKISFEFIGGTIFSLIGYWLSSCILRFLTILLGLISPSIAVFIYLGHQLFYFFIVLPAGSYIGILLTNHFYFEYQGYNKLGGIIGLLLNYFIGTFIVLKVMDGFGLHILIIPIIVVFSIIGFHYRAVLDL